MKKLIAMLFALTLACSSVAFAECKPADDKAEKKEMKAKKAHKKHKKEKAEKDKADAPKM